MRPPRAYRKEVVAWHVPEQQTGRGFEGWSRTRWLVVSAIVIAVIVVIALIVLYSGGGSGGGGY